MKPLACCIALLSWGATSAALAEHVTVPTHVPAGSPRLWLAEAHSVSAHAARDEIDTVTNPVADCIRAARTRDPAGLAATHAAVVVVRLGRDGHATAVEITPTDLPHGLSACLATALLAWHQTGYVGMRASVQLTVSLEP